MAISIMKGQKVDLTKTNPGLNHLIIGLGWEANDIGGQTYDIDASVFLLGANGKVTNDQDFVFYNNPQGGAGSVIYSGDNRTGAGHGDDEQIFIDLSRVPEHIQKLAFTITIHDAEIKRQTFGHVRNSYVRVMNQQNGFELIRYNLGQDFQVETAIVAAEVYRHNGEWKFSAIGSGFGGGLGALCGNFGIHIETQSPSNQSFTPPSHPNGQPSQYQSYSQQPTPYQNNNNMNWQSQSQGYGNQGSNQQGFGNYLQTTNQNPYGGPMSYQQQSYGQPNYNTGNHQPSDYICRKCGSSDMRSGKKGFGIGKAALGGLLLGPVGVLGGFIGGNKLKLTCNTCGYEYEPHSGEISKMANDLKYKTMQTIKQNKTPEVLDAIVAGFALVATADGKLDPSERNKVMEFVNQSEELRSFGSQQVMSRFDYFVNSINHDRYSGKAGALRSIGKVRHKRSIGSLIVQYGIALGYADGYFALEEKQMIAEICRELGLNPNDYLANA